MNKMMKMSKVIIGGIVSREKILNKFSALKVLNASALEDTDETELDFRFPKFSKPFSTPQNSTLGDFSVPVEMIDLKTLLPVPKLQGAINNATMKLRFADTNIEKWESELFFYDDSLDDTGLNIVRSSKKLWAENMIINESLEVANDWFCNYFLERLNSGTVNKHNQALIGGAGSGKSTLLKYLLSKNYAHTSKNKIVFSRFEFLKFLEWSKKNVKDTKNPIDSYVSNIHARDLLLAHFCSLTDGDRFEVKPRFQNEAAFEAEVERILEFSVMTGKTLRLTSAKIHEMQIREACAAAKYGNKALKKALSNVYHDVRIIIIAMLSKQYKLVTIFDGLDSLQIEDAFDKTDEWKLVCEIISNRSSISSHSGLVSNGVDIDADSLIVMRESTFHMITNKISVGSHKNFDFLHQYQLGKINTIIAMLGVMRRSRKFLIESDSLPIDEAKEASSNYVSDMMTIVRTAMDAICRWDGEAKYSSEVYGLFNGNLRSLFKFVLRIAEWSVDQMKAKRLLEPGDYGASVWAVTTTMANESGRFFVDWKNYRIIELLLMKRGMWFENEVKSRNSNSSFLEIKEGVTKNPLNTGYVDNIFNYLEYFQDEGIDSHCVFEKIRVLQLIDETPRPEHQIKKRLYRLFGYRPKDLTKTMLFLMKTGFVNAQVIDTDEGRPDVLFRASNKGRLCLNSIVFNLSYIEHVFHRTLLPSVMVEGISSKPRSADVEEWITQSIRNAYVFLCYLKMVEDNPSAAKKVPEQFRIVEKIRQSVYNSIEKMTEPGDAQPQLEHEYSGVDFLNICEVALKRIKSSERKWVNAGLC